MNYNLLKLASQFKKQAQERSISLSDETIEKMQRFVNYLDVLITATDKETSSYFINIQAIIKRPLKKGEHAPSQLISPLQNFQAFFKVIIEKKLFRSSFWERFRSAFSGYLTQQANFLLPGTKRYLANYGNEIQKALGGNMVVNDAEEAIKQQDREEQRQQNAMRELKEDARIVPNERARRQRQVDEINRRRMREQGYRPR